MSGPLAMWHTEHVYFRRLLELLQKELDAFHRGERPNYELMLDIVAAADCVTVAEPSPKLKV